MNCLNTLSPVFETSKAKLESKIAAKNRAIIVVKTIFEVSLKIKIQEKSVEKPPHSKKYSGNTSKFTIC